MDPYADIDLDSESVWLDGAWYTRDALAQRIRDMIQQGDFRVSRPSQALERLEAALARSRAISVRMPADLYEAVAAAGTRLGRPPGHLVREAIAYYLAAAAAYGAAQAGQPAPAQPAESGGEDVDVSDEPGSQGSYFKKAR
jgi:hypothetical protein